MSAPVVVGDGTTARSRAAGRWRRVRVPLVLLGVLLVAGLVAMLPAPRTSTTPFAPDSAEPNGSRALAQILGHHGVEVTYVRTSGEALAAATAGSTLLIVGDYFLDYGAARRLAATPADLVLVETTSTLDLLAPGLLATDYGSWDAGDQRDAECSDPDASAAGAVTAGGAIYGLSPDVVVCFPDPSAYTPGAGAYAVADEPGGRRITALADATPLTNEALATDGNAALTLRMLGRHPHLTWYLPSVEDLTGGGSQEQAPTLTDLLPPTARVLVLQSLLVLVVVVVWRARRLGPVVAERLPVVVRAGETTRGRGRLYRRGRSYAHAAASLRAGAADRCARRLGLPRSAGRATVVDAVAAATGRPSTVVDGLLYGLPPTDDLSLARLAAELDHLESEVHRT